MPLLILKNSQQLFYQREVCSKGGRFLPGLPEDSPEVFTGTNFFKSEQLTVYIKQMESEKSNTDLHLLH
jgi:hypothetical protein